MIKMNMIPDNEIGDEGARIISELLKINTTLTRVNLSVMKFKYMKTKNTNIKNVKYKKKGKEVK